VFSGRGWVDPVKEAKGAQMRMELSLSTQQDECAEQGKDYQEIQDQRIRELSEAMKKAKAAGLPPEAAYYIAGFPQPGQTSLYGSVVDAMLTDNAEPAQDDGNKPQDNNDANA
jgi:capsid protein